MPNGKIRLYNKLTNAQLVELDILNIFNIEDNLNDTPSNAKFKVITTNTYREEFEVNTVIYHQDTETWWVIKSDESTYLQTGEYEHEISVVEYLEWYSYKHLPNCAFAPATYDLEQMLVRLFRIARLTNVQFVFPAFLDKDKIMPFMSFENFTVANAVKNIGRAINAIPKMYVDITSGYVPKLTFVNRSGLDTAIVDGLDTQFPTQYEKNMNSSDQFLTRSVSNITNAKSSNLVIAPLFGGFKSISPNSAVYVEGSAKVFLPSKIDKVEFLRAFVPYQLIALSSATSVVLYEGYLNDTANWRQAILDFNFPLKLPSGYTLGEKEDMADELPTDTNAYHQVNLGDPIDKTYNPSTSSYQDNLFYKKMSLLSKFDFDVLTVTDTKNRTAFWEPNTNELVMPLSFRNGLSGLNDEDHNRKYRLFTDGTYEVYLYPKYRGSGFFNNAIPNEEILIQVGYYPIADIKVSIDNDNDSQDEKFYNQQGKVIDALSVSKLITSHTNDSVEGTKIRNARYTSLASILPLGQIVRDSNQLYIISQRSIDATIKNGNEYYNVVYTLTNNRIGRSENIVADSAVINYKTPDENLVFRTQLYKDYIELSLVSRNNDAPYLDMSKALVLGSTLAGTQFDYTVLARNQYSVPAGLEEIDLANNAIVNSFNVTNIFSTHIMFITQNNTVIDPVFNVPAVKLQLVIPTNDFVLESVGGSNSVISFYTSTNTLISSVNLDLALFGSSTYVYGSVEINIPTNAAKFQINLASKYALADVGDNQASNIFLNDPEDGVKVYLYKRSFNVRYIKNPTIFDLHKSKLMNVNWQDNNVLGYRLDSTGASYVQTPILYTDSLGKATAFELLFCNTQEIQDANADYNDPTPTDLLVPFGDLTQVPSSFYNNDVKADGRFSIQIETQFYAKDPFEIPVFEYMIQANDDYDPKGNVIVGNDLFSTFTGDIRYHYVINNTTRFTAENADKLYTANPPSSSTDRRVVITRTSGTQLDLEILSTHPSTDNTSAITNIGVYATDGTSVKFLFAINDYAPSGVNTLADIRLFINNWKI